MAGQVGVASRYTRVAASQTDAQINGGEPCIVHAIIVTAEGATAGLATFEETTSGTATILTLRCAASDSSDFEMEWLADDGLQVTTDANCSVTVFHSSTR